MKVFRFMSMDEFNDFLCGMKLNNNKKHEAHTNSIGFCFLNEEEFDSEYAYDFLKGIVSDDLCAEFETDENNLKKSWGIYADPYGSFFSTITVDEYCTEQYNNKDFKLLRIAKMELNYETLDYDFTWYDDIERGRKELIKQQKERKEKENTRKKKKIVRSKLIKKKQEDLTDFFNAVNKKHEIEIKIKDRYYKVPAYIETIEHVYLEPLRIKIDILIN